MTENPDLFSPSQSSAPDEPVGFELRGTPITPGLALGVIHRKDHDLSHRNLRRVPLEGIEHELNRFHASLRASKEQLVQLKDQLKGRVPPEHILILDTHIAYLGDSVFLSDVENLILNEQMSLEAAIAKVISDFDRIFRLVENELLRERAVDLRDVGIRVLRNLEPGDPQNSVASPSDTILVARELSIVDMFQLDGSEVLGIATEEGGLSSHAAILARSMGVPTITGLECLRERVQEGDFVILDASEGVLRVHPDALVRAQYKAACTSRAADERADHVGRGADGFETADGTRIAVQATCGNLPEVAQARRAGLCDIGLYRTELLYLIDRAQPSLDSLVAHYSAVLEESDGASVTFRLLDLNSSYDVQYMHATREPNPALGRQGVRLLLQRGNVLRRQLEAILRAAVAGTHVKIVIPFVTDVSELRGVKEALFDVRSELQRTGHRLTDDVQIGAIIETPAAALGIGDLLGELDFVFLSYDGLVQYLLASDRENHELAAAFEAPHPVVLRVAQDVIRAANAAQCPLQLFGATSIQPSVLPFLLAAGVRELCVAPVMLGELDLMLGSIDLARAKEALGKLLAARCAADCLPIVDSFVRAYDQAAASAPPSETSVGL